jgi:enamine deaminase RidA (YjgF/YER057c/UK114 family)
MWFGAAEQIRQQAPAASGVGHDGDDLVVHALAMASRGMAIENPDQVPAYHYSPRYGPVPPCFARATRVASPIPALFISGTAAITGEDSRFGADVEGQFQLALRNLWMVIAKAYGDVRRDLSARESLLQTLQHIRIYLPPGVDQQAVERLARAAFAASTPIEWVGADLCRSDLLVEIEGVARMS